jgi:cell wall-associated NlpC family hydrolase
VPARPVGARLRALTALLMLAIVTAGGLATPSPAQAATTYQYKIITEAKRHQGKPYQYGATGPYRFDCSGYTKYVFGRLGRSIPRTSSDQYRASRKISKSYKQVGDLIFYRNSSGRITHVGIYAGSNKTWIAPRSGSYVKLQTIYSSNYVVGRF